MKRLIILFFVIAIGFLLYFQYVKYRKFSPPNNYDYQINTKDIDVNYYDQDKVSEYFEKATTLGNFARQQWYNYEIDVLSVDDTPQAQNAAKQYQMLLARVKFLEAKLINSQKLKIQGFDNEAIKTIEEKKISPNNYPIVKLINGKTYKKGDKDKAIWEVQKIINEKGQKIQIDGFFSDETELAIKKIQEQAQSYPSGLIDEDFMKILLKK